MQVYITRSNAKRIISNLNHNHYYPDDIDIFKHFKWFSNRDKSEIISTLFLYKDLNKLTKVYRTIRRKNTTNQFVFESQASYHLFSDCERLRADFVNIKIPQQIKELGNDEIQNFKNFFIANKSLFEKKPDVFNERLRLKFNIIPERVRYENSGEIDMDNISLPELKLKVQQILSSTHKYYKSSDKVKIILDNFGKFSFISKTKKPPRMNNTKFSNEEIWEILDVFETKYKKPYKKYIVEFFRLAYNKELTFESNKLDELGFKVCNDCMAKQIAATIEYD